MAENNKVQTTRSSVKTFMAQPSTIKRVEELLGDRSSQFMTSVSSMVGADNKLANAEPISLFMACLTAAALDLPINKNLGFAHIIPYENKKAGVTEGQFQMGWKGYVQLAQRTGQYKTIAASAVYEGQLVDEDPLDGNTYDWKAKKSDTVIGYVARFKLVTGFVKEVYMSADDMQAHAKKYSKAYAYDLKMKYTGSPWSSNFEAMALKTVIKMLISKWGPMSVDMQKAVELDSSVIKENGEPTYIDGEDMNDVKADDAKKQSIIDANTDKATGEIKEPTSSDKVTEEEVAAAMGDGTTGGKKDKK